ncbi:MAG: hypothetical protein HW380_676 [Magnetococcales bacterium]|nr:hypothetical protein [Magnetococcales bacterium]
MTASRAFLSVEDLERCWLPKSAIQLIEVIGTAATLRLVQNHGGTYLALPRSIGPQHDVSNLIGFEAARSLAERWGGERVYIPKVDVAVRCVRNREMIARYEQGESYRSLVKEYAICDRWFWRIMKKTQTSPGHSPKENKQLSLFDD